MTDRGTFIINGAERVIVNQIVRSPGIYYKAETDKQGRRTYSSSLISNRGAWVKFETDRNDLVWVRIDKTRKIPAHVFLKAMGLSDTDIYNGLRHPEYLKKSFRKKKINILLKSKYKKNIDDINIKVDIIKLITDNFFQFQYYLMLCMHTYIEPVRTEYSEMIICSWDYYRNLNHEETYINTYLINNKRKTNTKKRNI